MYEKYKHRLLERCVNCDDATGRAGRADDSLYHDDGTGPYCSECYEKYPLYKRIRELEAENANLLEHIKAKTGDTVQDEQWSDVWHLVHPDDESWEYPGQVIRAITAEIERLTERCLQARKYLIRYFDEEECPWLEGKP